MEPLYSSCWQLTSLSSLSIRNRVPKWENDSVVKLCKRDGSCKPAIKTQTNKRKLCNSQLSDSKGSVCDLPSEAFLVSSCWSNKREQSKFNMTMSGRKQRDQRSRGQIQMLLVTKGKTGPYQPCCWVWHQLVRRDASVLHLASIIFLYVVYSAGGSSYRLGCWLHGHC